MNYVCCYPGIKWKYQGVIHNPFKPSFPPPPTPNPPSPSPETTVTSFFLSPPSLYISFSHSLSLAHFLSLTYSISFSLPLTYSFPLSLSVCLSFSLSLSFYLDPFPKSGVAGSNPTRASKLLEGLILLSRVAFKSSLYEDLCSLISLSITSVNVQNT